MRKTFTVNCTEKCFTKNSFSSAGGKQKYFQIINKCFTFVVKWKCFFVLKRFTTLEKRGNSQKKSKKFLDSQQFLYHSRVLASTKLFAFVCVSEYFNICWMELIFSSFGCTTNWGYSVGSIHPRAHRIHSQKTKNLFPPFSLLSRTSIITQRRKNLFVSVSSRSCDYWR